MNPGPPETLETSKSRQVYLLLRDAILSGAHRPGERLPGEHQLAESYGVSRVTIRRALAALQRGGLIDRRPGAGTVVRERGIAPAPLTADFSNVLTHLLEMGRNSAVRLLSFEFVDPPVEVREALRLDPQERTQRSVRVRLIDGEPFSYLTTHVPESIGVTYSEVDLAGTPLLSLLERSGVVADHATQTISAGLAAPVVAEALDLAVGAPLLALTRTVYDRDDRGVEHLAALYRPDLYRLQMNLTRIERGGDRHWAPIPTQSPAVAAGE